MNSMWETSENVCLSKRNARAKLIFFIFFILSSLIGDFVGLLSIGEVFHVPIAKKGSQPVLVYNTKVFYFYVVLDWMVNSKVDSRRDCQRLLTVVHNDADTMFSEGALARQ